MNTRPRNAVMAVLLVLNVGVLALHTWAGDLRPHHAISAVAVALLAACLARNLVSALRNSTPHEPLVGVVVTTEPSALVGYRWTVKRYTGDRDVLYISTSGWSPTERSAERAARRAVRLLPAPPATNP